MPRPRSIEPRRKLTLHIPQSIVERVETELDNGALGRRRKHGDLGGIISILLLRWLSGQEDIQPFELEEL